MNEITKKQRWVLVPCPDYDVPAMESWLEEQAMQGLFLSKDDGFFLGLACFESGAPRRVRYRLDAVPKEKAFPNLTKKSRRPSRWQKRWAGSLSRNGRSF